jgi:hypothetical protein
MSEYEIGLFKYTNIDKSGLIIIVHPDQELAAILANRIKKHCEIKYGDIFIDFFDEKKEQEKYFATFTDNNYDQQQQSSVTLPSSGGSAKIKPLRYCDSKYMEDLFARQGGHFSSATNALSSMSTTLGVEEKEKLSMLDEESKKKYLQQFDSTHFLPKKILDDAGLPKSVYSTINKFLVIQKSFFIYLTSQKIPNYFKTCMLKMNSTNSTLRILCVPSSKLIPSIFFDHCQTLFIFPQPPILDENDEEDKDAKNEEKKELTGLYKRAKLDCIVENAASFYKLLKELPSRTGLVFQKNGNKSTIRQETDGKKVYFSTTEMFYTTDRRPRQQTLFQN